jgi:hypothetical protein
MALLQSRWAPRQQTVFVSETPFDSRRIGAAAVYCSDGRFGEQMDEFLHRGLGLPRYDRVAVPGGAASLAGHVAAYYQKAAIERQLSFLIREHGLRRVVLIAHQGCAFYKEVWTGCRTVEEHQAGDLVKAAHQIRSWNTGVDIECYFARNEGGRVTFEPWKHADF